MNRNATAVLALLLVVAASVGAWRVGGLGTQYARVLQATPVSVREPRYADVVDAVPAAEGASDAAASAHEWDVAYRVGDSILHTRTPQEPGDQILVGEQRRVIGYDVVWHWRGRTGVARMGTRPGKHLPVVQGAVLERKRLLPQSS